jgi:hypothetical protein
MRELFHAPDRIQRCFNALDMNGDDEDLHISDPFATFPVSSGSSSLDGPIPSEVLNSVSGSVAGSITTVLSSAIANALTLSSNDHEVRQLPNSISAFVQDAAHNRGTQGRNETTNMNEGCISCRSNRSGVSSINSSYLVRLEPVDFGWLHERCEGDKHLAMEVLRTFCEQGQRHIDGMKSSIKEMDTKMLLFHAVIS